MLSIFDKKPHWEKNLVLPSPLSVLKKQAEKERRIFDSKEKIKTYYGNDFNFDWYREDEVVMLARLCDTIPVGYATAFIAELRHIYNESQKQNFCEALKLMGSKERISPDFSSLREMAIIKKERELCATKSTTKCGILSKEERRKGK